MDTAEAPRPEVSPLGRRFWTYESVGPRDYPTAELAGMLMGVHALARVLSNSEAFRGQAESDQDPPAEQRPLNASVIEGLFAALYFLSQHAYDSAEGLLEQAIVREES